MESVFPPALSISKFFLQSPGAKEGRGEFFTEFSASRLWAFHLEPSEKFALRTIVTSGHFSL